MSYDRPRGRWGNINFQSSSSNLNSTSAYSSNSNNHNDSSNRKSEHYSQCSDYDPPPPRPPGKGPYSNPLGMVPGNVGGMGGYNRAFLNLGKRRIKDDDDYFNDEDEVGAADEELAYQPAPGSPGIDDRRNAQANDSDEDDPLEKFMEGINNEVRCLYEKDKATNDDSVKDSSKGIRDDIEQEDEMESYMRFMEENPNVGLTGDEEDHYEYDADGNIIGSEKKAIDPLPPIDHSEIDYLPFEKNFYVEHEDIEHLSVSQINDLKRKLGIHVSGVMPAKPVCSFGHFPFDAKLIQAVRKAGYTNPTPIQAQAIPVAMSGRDVIGIAKTGSGKTAAFLWPLLVHIMDQPELKPGDGPIGLICAPTRELAQQIYSEAKKFSKVFNLQVVCAYGGGSMWEQQKACEAGCEILVCTPGRLIDLIKKKATNLRRVTYMVFDEADKMFNMGFEPQVRSIANHVRPDRQTLLFSATFKKKVERLARDILTDPIRIVQGELNEANEDITQIIEVFNKQDDKWNWLLKHLVQFTTMGSVLIFVTRKLHSEEVAQRLRTNDFKLGLIHGDMHQVDRNSVIQSFKHQEYPILVATDVAARGLDIPSIRTVINFDVARDIDTHTHRIGRTGRAGQHGTAYTLVNREKDKEFAAHLVRNLEGANQTVSKPLMDLASQNSWFQKTRFKYGSGKRLTDLGIKTRPGLGTENNTSGKSQESSLPTVASARGAGGPQTDRVAAMKQAFTAQYSRMFVSAGVESCKYTHPERLGATNQSGFVAPQNPSAASNTSHTSNNSSRRKKSRWD